MEIQFLEWLQTLHTPWLDRIMVFITSLGNAGLFWIALSVILAVYPKTRKAGFSMMAAMVMGAIAANLTLKPLIARTRPYDAGGFTNLLIAKPVDFSFPSGHTQVSFGCAWVIWYYCKKAGLPALILALLIAFSRMYLFVHYPTDVLGGFIVGTVSAYLSVKVVIPFIERKAEEMRNRKIQTNGGDKDE